MNKSIAALVAGVVIFLSTLGAIVALVMTGHDESTDMVLTLAGPVVAALLVTGHVTTVTEKQNDKIEKIEKQTNGVMDKRIEDGVSRALVSLGVVTPTGSLPAVPPRHAAEDVTQQQP